MIQPIIELIAVWLAFALMVIVARDFACRMRRKKAVHLAPAIIAPLASLYIFTTALVLSNYVHQANNLLKATTEEIVAIKKISTTLTALSQYQRVEGRRLLYDYSHIVATEESKTLLSGERSERAQKALDRFQAFAAGEHSNPSELSKSPEFTQYNNNINRFSYDIIDAREKRLSLVKHNRPNALWIAIATMFFTLSACTFLIHERHHENFFLPIILVAAPPIPALLLYIYSNPVSFKLVDIAQMFNAALSRSI